MANCNSKKKKKKKKKKKMEKKRISGATRRLTVIWAN